MTDLSIEFTSEGPAQVVRIGGELDLASAPQLTEALAKIDATNGGRLVIDLADCEFVDSAGLSAILHGGQQLSERVTRIGVQVAPPS